MLDTLAAVALGRPEVRTEIVTAYLAGFEAGYDLARTAEDARCEANRAGGRQGVGPACENGSNGQLQRFSPALEDA